MKGFVLVGLLASLGGACGEGRGGPESPGGPGGSDGPDGGTGAPDGGTQPPPRVTIVTGGPPALIVYREEAATEWRTPASPSAGRFEIDVAGPYRVIVV